MRAIGYIRVSTAEQADSGLGLEAQRRTVTAEVEHRGWTLVGIEEDAGVSGKAMKNRPGLSTALRLIEDGQAGSLVVAKLDRLSRSMLDFCTLMERSRRQGWSLVALDLGVDTSSAPGEMIANAVANFSQFERRLIGDRTRSALAVKRAQGFTLGRPRSLPDDVALRIVRLRDAGNTLASIAETLNAEGVPTAQGGSRWHSNTVRKILLSRKPHLR